MSPRSLARPSLGALALALVGPLLLAPAVLTAAPAEAATITKNTCLVADYVYDVRKVTHTAPRWVTYRVNWQSFGLAQTVTTGTRLENTKSSNVSSSAGVSGTIKGSTSENAILAKVQVEASISSDYRHTWGSTSGESRVVTTSKTIKVPAGTTLITYRARKVITGTYELSTCERQPGQSVRFGKVVWRQHRWSTYSVAGGGQWTCSAKAQTTPELQAQKQAGCL